LLGIIDQHKNKKKAPQCVNDPWLLASPSSWMHVLVVGSI
jgi:hypothetical protein